MSIFEDRPAWYFVLTVAVFIYAFIYLAYLLQFIDIDRDVIDIATLFNFVFVGSSIWFERLDTYAETVKNEKRDA